LSSGERALGATTSLGALVEALMSFARVDAGQIEHGLAAVRIADLVARVARGAPDADVEVAADDVLRAHPALLEAALANLVRNAVSVSPAGSAVVVSGLEHECNASPWRALPGVEVRVWAPRWPARRSSAERRAVGRRSVCACVRGWGPSVARSC
jgi:signal transduction histidine kinase